MEYEIVNQYLELLPQGAKESVSDYEKRLTHILMEIIEKVQKQTAKKIQHYTQETFGV